MRKENSTHSYEIDFLIRHNGKLIPIEVKSSSVKSHASIDAFNQKYSKYIINKWIVSQKEIGTDSDINLWPLYCLPVLMEES